MKYFGIIYKVTNIVNGKIYIGQTVQGLKIRKSQHLSDIKNNLDHSYFHNALNKYGKNNFKWEIIEYCNSKEEMDEMESHYITQYDSLRSTGYNITTGGDGCPGVVRSEEYKIKQSLAKKGKKLNISNAERKRRSISVKGKNNPCFRVSGKNHNQEKKFIITDPKGNKFIISGLRDFCRGNGLFHSCMVQVANGQNNHHKGYKCSRFEEKRL